MQPQQQQQLLPSLMNNALQQHSNSSSLGSSLSSLSTLDPQNAQNADLDYQLAVAQHQQQQQQQQFQQQLQLQQQQQQRVQQQSIQNAQEIQAALKNEMQLDEPNAFGSTLESQADLHRQYSQVAAQQDVAYDHISPSALSFAPQPDLVQSALQQAALDPGCESQACAWVTSYLV